MRRAAAALIAATLAVPLAAVSGVVVGTAPAAAATVTQTWSWPASGTVQVQGHGWGHGHGMSQWGAYGAAVKGLTYQRIMAFYYPGTRLATQTEPLLRVRVMSDADNVTQILPGTGVGVTTDRGSVADLPTSSKTYGAIRGWRAVRSGSGVSLQYLTNVWRVATVGGSSVHSYVEFDAGTSGTVRLVLGSRAREYRGDVRAVPSGTTTLQSVVRTSVTDYLRSVVPSEMPASWRAEALKSQAVAARTYALYDKAAKASTATYDTCDTTACQVFNGAADYTLTGSRLRGYESAASDAAVSATKGVVVTYGGALAFTQFSASNGGWMADGGKPYLVAKADPYDGVVPNSANSWTDTLTASAVQAAYPGLGTLRSVTLTRDGNGEWGGRITTIVLRGSSSTISTSGPTFASRLGLKHSWWAPSTAGWSTYSIVVGPGDWDGDGKADLIARSTDGRLWLLPGPAAPLGARRQIGTGFNVFNSIVAPGDWNGDGKNDLLGRKANGELWLYPGNGTGGFSGWRKVGTGWGSFTAIVGPGDWNGDRRPDLLARRTNGELWLYPGNGTGGFSPWRKVGTGWGSFTAIVGPGDWNGDRRPDLLARRTNGELWLYPGNGTGGFSPWRKVGTGWQPFSIIAAAGTLDADAIPDLVARTPAGNAFLYPGNGVGGFRPRTAVGTP